jgi:hypothetical protein
MEIIPENGTVLCEQVNKTRYRAEESGICYEKEEFPVYRILSVCDGEKIWCVGDRIVCDSTGTRLSFSGKVQFLFKTDNIAGRIAEQ